MNNWDNFIDGPHTFDPEESFYTRAVALNREDYTMEAIVPPGSVRFNVEETLQGEMRARILHHVYQEQLGSYYHCVQYPASWWDHFKQDVFPKLGRLGQRLLLRYPVEYTDNTVLLDTQTMYPEYRPLEGYGKPQYIVRVMERADRPAVSSWHGKQR